MIVADDVRVEDTRRGVQGIDGRVNPQFGDLTGQNRRRIEVREGSSRSRVRQVVGRDVDGLDGRDRTVFGRRNAFLQGADVGTQGRLVANGRRDTAE